jgi:hypothetical protein
MWFSPHPRRTPPYGAPFRGDVEATTPIRTRPSATMGDMGSYQGQATLILRDDTRIEGQADIRTTKHLWQGTIVVGPAEQERATDVTTIELPTGESRPVEITASQPTASGTYTLTLVSDTA